MKNKLLTIGLPLAATALVVGIGIASAASGLAGGGVSGGGPGGSGPGGAGFGFGGGLSSISPTDYAVNQAAEFQAEASALGLSVSVITEGWATGENLEQIATANGISTSTLQTDLKTYQQSQLTAQLQALVTNGTITQDQMNTRLAFLEAHAAKLPTDRGHWFRGPPGSHATSTATNSSSN